MDWKPGQGPDPVKVSGGVVEAYGRALKDMGAWDRVVANLTPEALQLFTRPPITITMVESYLVDPIIATIQRTLGDEATVEVGARAVRHGLMKYLAPMIRGTTQLFGTSPPALLSRLGQISKLNVSGVGIRWTTLSPNSGELVLAYPRPTLRANFLIWRGSVSVVFELCGTFGVIGPPRPNEDDTECRFQVTWGT